MEKGLARRRRRDSDSWSRSKPRVGSRTAGTHNRIDRSIWVQRHGMEHADCRLGVPFGDQHVVRSQSMGGPVSGLNSQLGGTTNSWFFFLLKKKWTSRKRQIPVVVVPQCCTNRGGEESQRGGHLVVVQHARGTWKSYFSGFVYCVHMRSSQRVAI